MPCRSAGAHRDVRTLTVNRVDPSISTITRPRRSTRGCSRRCCRSSPSTSATPHSQQHAFGWDAREATDAARARRSRRSSTPAPREIIFTSGATESNNLALKGAVDALPRPRQPHRHRRHRAQVGARRRACSSGTQGLARHRARRRRPTASSISTRCAPRSPPRTILVSVMAANNEIGTIQPLAEIGAIVARARRAAPHRRGAGGRQDPDRRHAR